MYTPFEIGLNYNMDHMRISGTEPWSVVKKYKSDAQKY